MLYRKASQGRGRLEEDCEELHAVVSALGDELPDRDTARETITGAYLTCFRRWFAVNMGTGIVSVLIHQLPYNAPWLKSVSVAFFVLNIGLFAVFTLITLLRYTLYPEIWSAMIRHPAQSLFLGCFPMGLASKERRYLFTQNMLADNLSLSSHHQHDRLDMCAMGRLGDLPSLVPLVG